MDSRDFRGARYLACALVCLSVLLWFAASPLAQSAKPMTNDDVIQMTKANFDEQTIIQAIDTSDPNFDTSVQGMIALKSMGVTEKVINAMLAAVKHKNDLAAAKAAEPKPVVAPAPPSKSPEIPDDVGMYAFVNSQLQEVLPEIIGWRSGGAAKSVFLGTKGHINGEVKGKHSKTSLALPITFIIKCQEGVSAAEFQLLRLDEKGDRREFRAVTGGYYHSSSGLDKDAVAFEFTKIAPRTYKIVLNTLKKGEYGFLPPGSGTFGGTGGGISGSTVQGGSASSGKLYTFTLLE